MAIFLILSFSATFATPRAFWFWSLYILRRSTDRSRKSWKTPILFLAQHRYSWWLLWSESKCTRSCKCCWNESKRKIAAKSFIKRDRWRILSWHGVYLWNLLPQMVQPIANVRVINRCNEMRTYCSHFGCWYRHA